MRGTSTLLIERNVGLADKTTFRIGGPARFFVRARSLTDVREALRFAREEGLPVFLLGGGSNVLIDDAGFEGLVIHMDLAGITLAAKEEKIEVYAAAGEQFDGLVARTVREGLWGLENLSGVPGSVGGAVVQNIGAYGAALSEHLLWVKTLDVQSGEVRQLENTRCGFGYRTSVFKQERMVILGAAFLLSRTPAPNLTYNDLRNRFDGTAPPLAGIRAAVLAIRGGKFPDLAKEGTAGSFFKNPIISAKDASRFPAVPIFPLPEIGGCKVALAYILDHELHLNGLSVGAARLYERQPLVIVAQRGASSREVESLAKLVEKKVSDAYGVAITREVRLVPE